MKPEQLKKLVQKSINGDEKAFAALCESQAPYILFLCKSAMGNWHDAEDAAQEVFIAIQGAIGRLQTPAAYTAWQRKIVFSVCTRMRQKRKDGTTDMDSLDAMAQATDNMETLPAELVESEEDRRRLAEVIESLPPKYSTCLLFHYYDNLTHAEIADIMGTTPRAVDGYLQRGRMALRAKLERAPRRRSELAGLAPAVALGPALRGGVDSYMANPAFLLRAKGCMEAAGVKPLSALAAKLAAVALPSKSVFATAALAAAAVAVAVLAAGYNGSAAPSPGSVAAGPPPSSAQGEAPASAPQRSGASPLAGEAGGGGAETPVLPYLAGAPEDIWPGVPAPRQPDGGAPSTRPGAQEKPAAEAPKPAQPASGVPTTIEGHVQLMDESNRPVPGGGHYGKGFEVQLARDGGMVATAGVRSDGVYLFDSVPLAEAGVYTVQLVPEAASGFGSPGGLVTVHLTPGESARAPDLHIGRAEPPTLEVWLTGADGLTAGTNPASVQVTAKNIRPVSWQWQLTDLATAGTAASGTGADFSAGLAGLSGGDYAYAITGTDAQGSEVTATGYFYIRQ